MTLPPLCADDLDRLRLVGHARISPDGSAVAYVDAGYDLAGDTTTWGIHVVGTDGSRPPRQLTDGPQDSFPRWSPDGATLAFLRGGALHLVTVATGEVTHLASLPRGIEDFRWSPEGDGFALHGRPAYPGPVGDLPPGQQRAAYDDRVVHVTRLGQRSYSGWADDEAAQVWWCPLDGPPQQLTHFSAGTTSPRFGAHGDITVGAADDDDFDLHPLQDLWSVPRAGGAPTRLAGPLNSLRGHQVLADGRVLHVGIPGTEWRYGVVNPRLFLDGDDVTGHLDRPVGRETEVQSLTLDYLSATEAPVLDERGRVWFNVVDGGCAHVYRLDETGKPLLVLGGRRLIGDFSVANGLIAWTETSPDSLETLRVARDDGSGERVLVDPNPWVAERALGEIRSVPLTLPDGTEVEGWAVLPAGWDGTPLPSVVDVHPGPHSSTAWDFKLEHRLVAEAGYVVLSCNHPGSAGYGTAFAELLKGRWGDADLPAYVALADEGVRLGLSQPGHIGISGITSGAYSALWALSHTDRFTAAVVNRAFTDMWTMYGDSDIGYWYCPAVLGAEPWEDPALYHHSSPVAHAHLITAPVRFLAFESNVRTTTQASEAVFVRLRKNKVPTDLLVYPVGTATVFMPNRPSLRKHMLAATVEWWDRYL